MGDLSVLLKVRALEVRNQFLHGAGRKRALVLGGAGLLFAGGLFLLACRVLLFFRSQELVGDLLPRHLLSMFSLIFFSLLAFSHVVASLSTLFFSRDLAFCHAAPVLPEELFLSRAVRAFGSSSWMLIVFVLPILLAYAYVFDPGPAYYLHLVHLNLALAIIAAGLATLVTLVLMYVFPAHGTRDLIVLLAMLTLIALYLTFRFLRPERLVNPEAFLSVVQYLDHLKAPRSPLLPSQWVSESLWHSLTGSRAPGQGFRVLLLWSSAGTVVVANVWAAHFLYLEGFSKAQEAAGRRRRAGKVLDLGVGLLVRLLPRDLAAVLGKDVRSFFRDRSQWSQLLLLGALVVVYVYNFSVLPIEKSPLPAGLLRNHLAFLNMGLAGLVLSAVAARFALTAVSLEGEAYWVLQSAPLGLGRYLWGKYAFYGFPLLLLAEALVVVTNHYLEVSGPLMWLSAATMVLMAAGITGLAVGCGAWYPDFRHQNIAQVATGFAGLMFMLVSAFFIALLVVLEAAGMYFLRYRSAGWLLPAACLAAVLALTGASILIPMKQGLRALEGRE